MNNVMIDLETMGKGSDAAIIAIGAVMFDDESVNPDGFYQVVDLESSMLQGCVVDASTILWWMKQSDDARKEFFDNTVTPLPWVLNELTKWLPNEPIIWGNGATFDNVILSNAYNKCLSPRPWSYKNDRCYRTVVAQFPDIPFENIGIHHNALDDAKAQALHLIKCWDHDR